MLLGWFNAKEAHRFGGDLARFFIERMPLTHEKTDKKFAAKAQKLLTKIDIDVQRFKASHPLNIYTRARLGQQFKWTLKDSGYDPTYVDELTAWLVKRL